MSKRKYPTIVYVARDDDDDNTLIVNSDYTGVSSGTEVAIYELIKVARVQQSTTLIDVKHVINRPRRGR